MTRAPVKMWAVWGRYGPSVEPERKRAEETAEWFRKNTRRSGAFPIVRVLIVPPGYRVVKIRRKRK